MKKTMLWLGALALVGGLQAAMAADVTTLNGEWIWERGDSDGPLEAVFTPTGEGTWDVAFHFEFRGEPHVYKGQARGSLAEGALQGEVKNENGRRTFTFEGKFDDGKFRGKHAETTGGSPRSTGTLTLHRG